MSYIFGGNTGNSYDDIKRIRQQANAIKPTGQIRGGINGFGEGLSTLGRALMYRNMNKKADDMEQQDREQFNQQFAAWQQPKEMMVASTEPMVSGMPPRDPQAELMQLSELAHSPYASKGQQTALQLLLQQKIEGMKPKERKIMTDAAGRQRYQDDGSFVFQDMQGFNKDVLSEEALAQKIALAQAGRSSTNVNVVDGVKAPQGFIFKDPKDPRAGVVPLSGSMQEANLNKTNIEVAEKQDELDARKQKQDHIQQEALSLTNELLANRKGTLANFGGLDSILPNTKPESIDAQAKLEQLESILTADNLGLMSGVLSESDIAILKNISAGGLNRRLSDDKAIENIEKLRQSFTGKVNANTPTTPNDPLGLFK